MLEIRMERMEKNNRRKEKIKRKGTLRMVFHFSTRVFCEEWREQKKNVPEKKQSRLRVRGGRER